MPRFTEKNAILEDGIFLPKFLFYSESAKSNSISPTAAFNPASAINGQPFQSSTSPSKSEKKKTLIIDKNSLKIYKDYGEKIALLKRLKVAGFKIFLCTSKNNQNAFEELDDKLSNINSLHNLCEFNTNEDYQKLADQNIARDTALLLGEQETQDHIKDIRQAFSQHAYTGPFFGNGLKCDFLTFNDDEIPNIGLIISPEKFAFYLAHLSKDEARAKIEKELESFDLKLEHDKYKNESLDPSRLEGFLSNIASGLLSLYGISPDCKDSLLEFFKKVGSQLVPERDLDLEKFYENVENLSLSKLSEIRGIFPDLNIDEKILYLILANKITISDLIETELLTNDQKILFLTEGDGSSISDLIKTELITNGKKELFLIRDYSHGRILIDLYSGRTEEFIKKVSQYTSGSVANYRCLISAANAEGILTKELLKNFLDKIKATTECNEFQINRLFRRVIKHMPQMANQVINGFPQYLEKNNSILDRIEAFPERAEDLVQRYIVGPYDRIGDILSSLPEFQTRLYEANPKFFVPGIDIEKLNKINYFKNINTKPKPTYLSISGLNDDRKSAILEAKIDSIKFDEVAVLRFGEQNSAEKIILFLDSHFEELKSLKHVILSDKVKENQKLKEKLKQLEENGISYEFNDYQNYLGISDKIREIEELNNVNLTQSRLRIREIEEINKASSTQFSQAINPIPPTQDDLPKPKVETSDEPSDQFGKTINSINVAQNGFNKNLGVNPSDKPPTYNMVKAGEVLNRPDLKPQIRTIIIERDILSDLDQQEYLPKTFSEVASIKSLNEEKIENFRKPTTDVYYQFSINLAAHQKFRLLSADAKEQFIGIVGDIEGISIQRGDDDFFYATSNKDVELTYILSAPDPQKDKTSYEQISSNNPIKKIIDEYRDESKGFSFSATAEKENPSYNQENHQDSMERMFEERSGVCRHRVAAVEYKLKKSGINQESFRSVVINNNHDVLEIKDGNDKWIKVDLGGGEGVENNLGDSQKLILKPVEVPSQKENAKNESRENPNNFLLESLKITSEEFDSEQNLKTQSTESEKNKILLITNSTEEHANFLINQAVINDRPVFYIDNPQKIDLHRTNLIIANDNTPRLEQRGLLVDFLENAKNPKSRRPLLIINWNAFDSKQKVALNTVLDLERKINGKEIDPSIQIIGLVKESFQDPSFISRHDLSFRSTTNLKTPIQEQENTENQIIDLEGFTNWRQKLFGKIVLIGDEMVWQKSEFVKALEKGEQNFEIFNLSNQAVQDFRREFNQAQAHGKFIYHGHEIAINTQVKVVCSSNSFDFNKFSDTTKVVINKEVNWSESPQDSFLINTQIFDHLLCDKKIENGKYLEKDGLIAKAAKTEEKILKLFISSNLSEGQWYCLFNEAQKEGVKLELYLAPQVKIPGEVKFDEKERVETENKTKIPAQIIISNNPDQALAEIKQTDKNIFAVIDIEDCNYQDLVEKIAFEIKENQFQNFSKTKSEIITKLEEGQKIVLKGEFAPDLLQMLEPILTKEFSQNLILIIEDKNCEEDKDFEALSWLGKDGYEVKKIDQIQQMPATEIIRREIIKDFDSINLENSQAEAEEFINERKRDFSKALQENNLLCLVGTSGVGKSRLLKEFEENESNSTAVYRELANFEEWAKDQAEGKTKILFIDESNIDNLHFTTFSPLKNQGQNRIFYQGKFYDLSPNHKVVFAHNDVGYGGGRVKQKLFDDGKIPVMRLQDFPSAYIYEKILKSAIFDELSKDFKISEAEFKEICAGFIQEYKKSNFSHKGENLETVRELQNKVLVRINERINVEPRQEIKSKNFISTYATKEVEDALGSALDIKKRQREKLFPTKAVGLNAVLLEGDSGTGKSELIFATLASRNITEKKLSEIKIDQTSTNQRFYKIDASLSTEEKKQIIIQAFEEGNIVWIDEINSCIDDGLEKIVNAALTGDHPNGETKEVIPGFMLISSVNSAGLEGRSTISPALRHRCIQPKVKSLKEYSRHDLSKIVKHWLEQKKSGSKLFVQENYLDDVCQNIASDFQKCLKTAGENQLNLRKLRSSLEDILPNYLELVSKNISKMPSDSKKLGSAPKNSFKPISSAISTLGSFFKNREAKKQPSERRWLKIPTLFSRNKAPNPIVTETSYNSLHKPENNQNKL